jgi:hypothetical protein
MIAVVAKSAKIRALIQKIKKIPSKTGYSVFFIVQTP